MLRRQREIQAQMHKLLDATLFALGLWLAHSIRTNYFKVAVFGGTPEIQPLESFYWLFPIIAVVGPLLLEVQGFYSRPLLTRRRASAWQLAKACSLVMVVAISLLFLAKQNPARSVIMLFGPASFILLGIKEELRRQWMQSRLGRSQVTKRIILVGDRAETEKLHKELCRSGSEPLEVVACMNLNEASIDTLVHLLHEHSANGVMFAAKHTFFGQIEKAIQACELEGVEAWLMADFFNTHVSQTTLDDFNGRPMLVFRSTPADSWQKVAKNAIDMAGALFFLTLFSWAFLLIALFIKATSPGPVLFRQKRSGLNGKPFTMLKFRSMITDAEQLKDELRIFNEMDGPVFKVTNDPRVTAIGRLLRRWSIDEWPQMVNVLLGQMSLVGPRPLPVDEVLRFDDFAHRRRLSVKPGLTCLWQVNGRNEVKNFKDWVRLDLEYIDNWSLWLDLRILARTVPAVIMGTGAK